MAKATKRKGIKHMKIKRKEKWLRCGWSKEWGMWREGCLVGPAGRSHVKAGGVSMQDDGGRRMSHSPATGGLTY